MLIAILSASFISCGDDDEKPNPNNVQPVNPDIIVDDPEGTIMLSMRNTDNGRTYLDNSIYIKNENFAGANFVSLGEVKGLGNVTTIPTTGWAQQVSVIVGNGYVAYANGQFYRIYVLDNIVSTTGGIIGADIKYQKPFNGVDEAISVEERELTFGNNGGDKTLVLKNKNMVLFDVSSDQSWCSVHKRSTYDHSFLYNAICISVEPSYASTEETANVCLKTPYGKELLVKVTRTAGKATPQGTGTLTDPYNVSGVLKFLESLGADKKSDKAVYIKGKVKGIKEQFSTLYGNGTFTMIDEGYTTEFTAYRVLYLGNMRFLAGDTEIKENDEVIVYGKVVNFNGNAPKTVPCSEYTAYLYSLNGKTEGSSGIQDAPTGAGTATDPFNVAAAVAKCQETGTTATTDIFYVKGIVNAEYTVDKYKNATFDLVDIEGGTRKFKAFRVKGVYGKDLKEGYTIPMGATVIVSGKFINYNGNSAETAQGTGILISINGQAPQLDGEDDDGENQGKRFLPPSSN